MKFISKFFRKEKDVYADLTNPQKVSVARETVEQSLSMFSDINDNITKANDVLAEVMLNDSEKVKELNNNIERANSEMKANLALQEKIKQFIV